MGRSRAVKLWSAVWVVCGLWMLVASRPASADTIMVTNTNDAGAGSLRQAIIDVMPGGTIVVPSGDYTVASGELAISKSLTISGAGAATTIISNAGSSRVFHTSGSGNTITISGVTIRLGHPPTVMGAVSGGGVDNAAKLTLREDVIADNRADADAAGTGGNGGNAQGGGVFNDSTGTLVVEDSEIMDNHATAVGAPNKSGGFASGGGIETGGNQTIEGSTFSGNTAEATGGGGGASGGISHGGGLEVAAVGPTSLSREHLHRQPRRRLRGRRRQHRGYRRGRRGIHAHERAPDVGDQRHVQ